MEGRFLLIFVLGLSTRLDVFVGAQVTGHITVSSCEGDFMVLMCPPGSSIKVLEALFGYTLSTGNNCSEESIPECNRNIPFAIQIICDHRESCRFQSRISYMSPGSGCPSNSTNSLTVVYTCSEVTTTASSSSPATITVTPTYRHTSQVSTTLVTATSTQETTETAKQVKPETALPFTSSITSTGSKGTAISDTLGSTPTSNLRNDGIQCVVIGGTLGAISLVLLIFNIAAVCYIFRKKRSEKALPQSSNHSDQTHKNQDDREGGENTYAQLGEQEPQQQYTELELQRKGTQFHEENERQYVNQALPKSSDYSDQTHRNQNKRKDGENVYAQLGEQEPQQQYTELELQRRSIQAYEKTERQYVNQGFQRGVADSHGI